ncbi:MAG: DNA-processing protein DprA [Acidimicrobiales bacterium]
MNRFDPDVPDIAYAVLLASLDEMTPVRLSRLLRDRVAADVYRDLLAGSYSLAGPLLDLPSFGRRPGRQAGDRDPSALPPEVVWGSSGSEAEASERRGRVLATLRAWAGEARQADPAASLQALTAAGIGAVRRGDNGYPRRLLRAQTAPEVLYFKGSLADADAPCVGIVGTRKATPYGSSMASELAREVAAGGGVVVSGLARGIDAAAHWGVLAPGPRTHGPLAVVGGGVDFVYPRDNAKLWSEVVAAGGLMSDAPPGAAPEPWRFPLRNRLIAALCLVLVVVESTRQGGAMHTVNAADAIGVPVLAVPGSIRSPQSEGTNAIIQAGKGAVLDVHDVLVALDVERTREMAGGQTAGRVVCGSGSQGREGSRAGEGGEGSRLGERGDGDASYAGRRASPSQARAESRKALLARCSPHERSVLAAVEHTPTPVELVCQATSLGLGAVALCLDHLEELGLVKPIGPDWYRI